MSGLRDLLRKANKGSRMATLLQFIKFGIVGVSNTAISYGTEMLFYYVILVNSTMSRNGKVMLTSAVAFIVSVTNSYFWNSRFVFKKGSEKKGVAGHLKSDAKPVACYGVTGHLLAPAIKILLGSWGMPYWAAILMSLVVTIPLNFVLNKFWAFGEK